MKRKILVFTLMILTLKLFGQDILFEKDIKLFSGLKDKRESLPIVNRAKGELALFLLDNQNINCLIFNKEYELTDELTTIRPETKFSNLLGHSIDSNRYYLYFTNTNENQFYIESLNARKKQWYGKKADIKLKDEKYLESISYKGKFYILTVKKMASILNIYVFDGNTLVRTGKIDLSDYKFSGSGHYYKLFDVLTAEGLSLHLSLTISKIDVSNPNPLDLTAKENKLYYFGNKLYMTLDNDKHTTKLITIDLKDFSSKVKFYDQIETGCDTFQLKCNSYLYRNYLYQIGSCKDELGFRIINLTNDSVIKEYRVKKDEEITFKNSPLMYKNDEPFFGQGTEKELESTKKVLRKMHSGNIGISVRPLQENVEVTIGGVTEVSGVNGGAAMPMSSGGTSFSTPHGTITVSPTYHYNPSMYVYNKYSYSWAVYFKSLLDKVTFDHVEGDATENVYNKIKNYEDDLNYNITSETIFKVDDYYVFGYYYKFKHVYYLLKFTN